MNPKLLTVLALPALCAALATSGSAQTKLADGNPEAGRTLALWACTGCHVVTPDQRMKPIYTLSPRPPSFKDIANRPGATAAALQQHLESLPTIPEDSRMANPDLSSEELRNVVAFILSLRDKQTTPTQ